jgi:chaperonin GroEL (HSP60 family)
LPCSQVAGRTNDSAGDGTTTASVLAREMIHFGLQNVTAGANPIAVKKGIDKTCEYLVGKLKEHAKPVKGREDIKVRSSAACRAGAGGGAAAGAEPQHFAGCGRMRALLPHRWDEQQAVAAAATRN